MIVLWNKNRTWTPWFIHKYFSVVRVNVFTWVFVGFSNYYFLSWLFRLTFKILNFFICAVVEVEKWKKIINILGDNLLQICGVGPILCKYTG